MFGVGSGELLVILIVVFLLFGPEKLPELAKTLGKIARDIRKASDDVKSAVLKDTEEVRKTVVDEPKQKILEDFSRKPTDEPKS